MPILPQQPSLFADTKFCPDCNDVRGVDEFYTMKTRQKTYRLSTYCKTHWNARGSARTKKWAEENPEKYRAKYEAQNAKAERKAYAKEYVQKNREGVKHRLHEWYLQNPQKFIDHTRKKRSKIYGPIEGHHTVEEWIELCNRYDNRCMRCYRCENLAKDHIVPISRGGTDYITNLQLLCKRCNSRKYNKHINYRPDRMIAAKE